MKWVFISRSYTTNQFNFVIYWFFRHFSLNKWGLHLIRILLVARSSGSDVNNDKINRLTCKYEASSFIAMVVETINCEPTFSDVAERCHYLWIAVVKSFVRNACKEVWVWQVFVLSVSVPVSTVTPELQTGSTMTGPTLASVAGECVNFPASNEIVSIFFTRLHVLQVAAYSDEYKCFGKCIVKT